MSVCSSLGMRLRGASCAAPLLRSGIAASAGSADGLLRPSASEHRFQRTRAQRRALSTSTAPTGSSGDGPLFGAIDQGTSSSRFILYDASFQPRYSHQILYDSDTPQPGWVEQNPDTLLSTVTGCIDAVMTEAAVDGVTADRVAGVGITNQRETTVVWHADTGRPLHPALVWLDTRTAETVDSVVAGPALGGDGDGLRAVTGLPVSTYFSAAKLRWLLDNVPEVAEAAATDKLRFGTVDTWLLYNMTGGVRGGRHVTDVTNASRTCLMDLSSATWSEHCLDVFGVPGSALPDISSSAEVFGTIAEGPLAGVPLSGVVGDQQAALVGQRCFQKGDLKDTFGTGSFMLMNTGDTLVPSRDLLTTAAYQLGPSAPITYALEGSVAVAGVGIKWLEQNLGIISGHKELNQLAATLDSNEGVYFVPAFSGLLAPWWRSDARGVLVGLTHRTTRAHVCRAMLEAMAFQTADVVRAMEADAGFSVPIVKVDGGVSRSDLLLRLLADVLATPIERPANIETTAIGAAMAAAVGCGHYSGTDELAEVATKAPTVVEPAMDAEQRSQLLLEWHDAVRRTFGLADVGSDAETTDSGSD